MTPARCLFAVVAVGLAACDTSEPAALVPPDDDLAVRVDRDTYVSDDPVRLTLANETDRAVELSILFVLGCSIELERLVGDVWSPVPLDGLTPMCTAETTRLAGGATLAKTVRLHADVPGTYRYAVGFESSRQRAFSPPFTVR